MSLVYLFGNLGKFKITKNIKPMNLRQELVPRRSQRRWSSRPPSAFTSLTLMTASLAASWRKPRLINDKKQKKKVLLDFCVFRSAVCSRREEAVRSTRGQGRWATIWWRRWKVLSQGAANIKFSSHHHSRHQACKLRSRWVKVLN